MTIASLLNRDCTILRRSGVGGVDEYGNELPGEEEEETICELQQRQRGEEAGAGELSETIWLLVLPAGTDIRTDDAIEVDGWRYEMLGEPWHAIDPESEIESHVEATVRRVAGGEEAS